MSQSAGYQEDMLAYWEQRLERDLSPFCDPGTILEVVPNGRSFDCAWETRGAKNEARFTYSTAGGMSVAFRGQELSYRSFLASDALADLYGLAKMVGHIHKGVELYIDTKAKRLDSNKDSAFSAVDLINETILSPGGAGVGTQIIMITGDAGAGKTSVLKQLVKLQAEKYVSRKSDVLYLYIDAQGRALSRLNEALATELQDLRASTLTYHGVATLVKAGILVPIIDGFDELLGASGYDDAFSSLSSFIDDLEGEGVMLASARSAYYQDEFKFRAESMSSSEHYLWNQIPVRIEEWGDDEVVEYLDKFFSSKTSGSVSVKDKIEKAKGMFVGANADLLKKPLFIHKVAELVLSDVTVGQVDDLLDTLISIYLERERTQKLLSTSGAPLLTKEQLFDLLASLAEEMWHQEARELDKKSIKEIVDYELSLLEYKEDAQAVVIERMPNAAFLSIGSKKDSVAFEHEIYFSYFLGSVFANSMCSGSSTLASRRVLFGRSALPATTKQYSVRMVFRDRSVDVASVNNCVSFLGDVALAEGAKSVQIKENAGTIMHGIFEYAMSHAVPLSGLAVKGVVFPGMDFCNLEIVNSSFADVTFRRNILRNVKFKKCKASNLSMQEVSVDVESTVLEIDMIDPIGAFLGGLIAYNYKGSHEGKSLYTPQEISSALVKIGLIESSEEGPTERAVNHEYVEMLSKLERGFRRSNIICMDDKQYMQIFSAKKWEQLRDALLENKLLKLEHRKTSGSKKMFLRRVTPIDVVMKGLRKGSENDEKIEAFWSSLEKTS